MATYISPLLKGFFLFFTVGASAYVRYPIPDLSNRIIGGFEAYPQELPYQLALEGAPNGRHMCGGSVLSTYWAITAAHCVYDKPIKSLRFRAGTTTLGANGTHHPVKFYLYHDNYRRDTLDYDLALVRVKRPFHFGPKVRPVQLPRAPPTADELALVSGWGFLQKEQLRKPKNLMAAEVFVKSWEDCRKIYPQLTPRMFCAGADFIDFCSGDSGGPLVRPKETGSLDQLEQLGVVSWLYKCDDGLPGVYTNISSMMPWIVDSLKSYGVYLHTDSDPDYSPMVFPETDYTVVFPKK